MRSTVTAAQIASYQRDGFIVIEDALSPAEVAELAAGVERGVATMGTTKLAGSDWKDGDSFYDKVFVQRLNLWKVEPTVKRYMLGPEIGRMATELAGVEGMRVWHDQTLQKKPWANPTSWHLDVPYWSYSSRHAISVWIALDESTLQNGCMYYLPGSHNLVNFDNVGIGQNMDSLFELYPQLAKIEPVAAPMKPGTLGFHNGLTAHGAGPNMTPRWRRAMTCGFMPIGSTFNGNANILPAERLARLKIGDSLDDEAENPLVWRTPALAGSAR